MHIRMAPIASGANDRDAGLSGGGGGAAVIPMVSTRKNVPMNSVRYFFSMPAPHLPRIAGPRDLALADAEVGIPAGIVNPGLWAGIGGIFVAADLQVCRCSRQ